MYFFLWFDKEREKEFWMDAGLWRRVPSSGESPGEALFLSKPVDHEELYIYLAVSQHAISAALIREEYRIQKPVYYVSKRLTEAERITPR